MKTELPVVKYRNERRNENKTPKTARGNKQPGTVKFLNWKKYKK